VERAQAVLLTGGSAFGLAAADGVMRYLEERDVGYHTRTKNVPIVPAAVLFDLGLGDPEIRPDAESGYRACLAATEGPVEEGSVGAGTGATVGKVLGMEWAMKTGLGTASETLPNGITVGALAAVNALGDVLEPRTERIVAGARRPSGDGFLDTLAFMQEAGGRPPPSAENTTLGVVATDAPLTVSGANYVAQTAHNALALTIRPAHTMHDGDTVFALSLAGPEAPPVDVSLVSTVAVEVLAEAILRAATQAEGLMGLPAYCDLAGGE
jgi:L-aminopeptidase/D-esterase-like protein